MQASRVRELTLHFSNFIYIARASSSDTSADVMWKCTKCTFENKTVAPTCFVCGEPQPAEASWKCQSCTFINAANNVTCGVCGAAPSPTKPKLLRECSSFNAVLFEILGLHSKEADACVIKGIENIAQAAWPLLVASGLTNEWSATRYCEAHVRARLLDCQRAVVATAHRKSLAARRVFQELVRLSVGRLMNT